VKISIIGCGKVGSALAYTLLARGKAEEILLIDIDTKRRDGEVLDLIHAQAPLSHSITILKGDFEDVKGSKVVAITAGLARKPGESRLDLLRKNANILKEILSSLPPLDSKTILFIISNPVDVLTYLAAKYTCLPPKNILGLGTVLDTMRFKAHIGEYFNVVPSDLEALILGEHGESMVPIWSLVRVAGIPLREIKGFREETKGEIFGRTRQGGALLNESKGGTSWGVAMACYEVIKALSSSKKRILPITALVQDYQGINEVSLSLPTFLSADGIGEKVELSLSPEEMEGLKHSAAVLKEAIKGVEG